jgi:diguanylate cyclase (GGDEF)-like protein
MDALDTGRVEALLPLMRRTPLLGPLAEEALRRLLRSCGLVRLKAGEALCKEGEEGHTMYLVLTGHLVISKGGKQVAVGSPGDSFGEMALIESRERAATLRALDEATVLEIPEEAFREHLAPHPSCLMALLRVFSDRSRRDLEALASDNVKLQSYAAEVERTNQALEEIRRELEDKNRLLARLSALDTLTGIANRRRFDDVLRQEWRRATRDARPISIVFCDIDHFKRFNDTYGHQAGDECLMRVAQAMDEAVSRPGDLVARYGGEEFVALLVDTDAEGARILAERMRSRVEALAIEHRAADSGQLTVSLGVATITARPEIRPEDVVDLADRALYAAKQAGRNRVVCAGSHPPTAPSPG